MSAISSVKTPLLMHESATLAVDQAKVQDLKDSATQQRPVKELARDFESLLYEIMLRSMRSTVPKSEFIDGGNAEDIYRSMLDSEYAKIMSQTQNSGLTEAIEKQLLQR